MNNIDPIPSSAVEMRGSIAETLKDELFLSREAAPTRWAGPVYGAFYDLNVSPFDLTPDPRFLFLSSRQREALSNLRYGLESSKGFTLLVGDAGTGKTTLIRTALESLGDSPSRCVLVSNPTLNRSEFYEFLAQQFELSAEAASSKTCFLTELQRQVEARFAAGGLTGLIIDEAQSMPRHLLEEIRLLGNIETTTTKLLSIVLCGQPELSDRLNHPSLRQLKQRIALRCELQAFTFEETLSYIAGRLRIAGGSPAEIFSLEAVTAIHNAAAGIPRTVNVLCDNALIGGFAAQLKPIPRKIVEEACRDFDLVAPSVNASAGHDSSCSVSSGPVETTDSLRPGTKPAANVPRRTETTALPGFNAKPRRPFSFFN